MFIVLCVLLVLVVLVVSVVPVVLVVSVVSVVLVVSVLLLVVTVYYNHYRTLFGSLYSSLKACSAIFPPRPKYTSRATWMSRPPKAFTGSYKGFCSIL